MRTTQDIAKGERQSSKALACQKRDVRTFASYSMVSGRLFQA